MSRNGKDDRPASPSSEGAGDRDEVDRKITRSVRAARAPRDVPSPGPAEPSDDTLLRYLEGAADADERRQVEEAAGRSPFTADRLQILGDAMRESGTAPAAAARVARWAFAVAKDALSFLRGATTPVSSLQPAWATRGEPAHDSSFYEFKQDFSDVEALVRVEHVTRPKATPTLDLQVRLVSDGNPQNNGRVTIRRAGRTIDSIPTENDGSATFTGLAPDRYEVELRTTGQVIGVMVLDFLSA